MSGKSLVYTVDVVTANLSGTVREVLPDLARKSHRFAASRICPKCGEHKASSAKQCQPCFRNVVAFAKAMLEYGAIVPTTELSHKWRRGLLGTTPSQPSRPRMVKKPDGTWEAAE